MAINVSHPLKKREYLTLIVLTALCMWAVHPLLEEWDLFSAFQKKGVSYVFSNLEKNAWRPLHLVSYGLQWLLGLQSHTFGVALFAAIMLTGRYLFVRWAIQPLAMNDSVRWLICTVTAVMPGWSGVWLGRFASAQISVLCFLVVLGCGIRLERRFKFSIALISVVSLTLMLMVYQALALCVALIPVWLYARRRLVALPDRAMPIGRADLRVVLTLAAGLLAYVIYGTVVAHIAGSEGYEGEMAGGMHELLTISGVMLHLKAAYATAWLAMPALMPYWLLLLTFLAWGATPNSGSYSFSSKLKYGFGGFLCLPLMSFTYVSPLHLNDPERVILPAVTGLVMLMILLGECGNASAELVKNGRHQSRLDMRFGMSKFAVAMLLATAVLTANTVQNFGRLQASVLRQLLVNIPPDTTRLVLRDYSGLLGDVYTFYSQTLTQALTVSGRKIYAVICTPVQVDRRHPYAAQFPISSTARCVDSAVQPTHAVVLNIRKESRDWVVSK